MCLAIPARIMQLLEPHSAVVDLGGVRKTISTALLDNVNIGDYVIVHVGYALAKLDQLEAQRTLQLFQELS